MSAQVVSAVPPETAVFRWLNFDGGRVLDAVAVALSDRRFGVGVGILFVAFIVWLARRAAIQPMLALAGSIAISDGVGARVLRPLFGRVRPCYALPHEAVRWLAPAGNVGSLPSLHAANLFALAFVATRADRRLAAPAYLTAIAVAWSRVYVGAHWPTDVIAGAAWGTLAGAVCWALAGAVVERVSQGQERLS